MRYATGRLHTLAHRSLRESWFVMFQSGNGDECKTQTDRQTEPQAFTEEMGKTWKQMDNCENEIIIHIAMQHTDMLQVAQGRKYRYLLFSYFPQGTRGSFFSVSGDLQAGELGDSGEERRKDRRWGCDGDGHPLKVNRGVRTLFLPEVEACAWQPVAPPSLWQADQARVPVCLSPSASESGDKKGWRGCWGLKGGAR